jgi:natural product precursor
MKTKIFTKKLNLNKQTISNLKSDEMTKINGGGTRVTCTIMTCGHVTLCEACSSDPPTVC